MERCKTCGEPLEACVSICPVCGTPTSDDTSASAEPRETAETKTYRTRDEWYAQNARMAGIVPGFSPKFDTPEFQAALKAGNSFNTRVAIITLLVLPPVVTLIASLIMRESIAILVGACIVVYAITIPVVVYQLVRRNAAKPWDGEVIDLIHRRSREHPDTFLIVCRTDAGKRKKIKDYANRPLYGYLQIGDRVRYHPRLNVPLEKYDKTHDTYLVCPFCGSRQVLENDDCDKCHKPLLK